MWDSAQNGEAPGHAGELTMSENAEVKASASPADPQAIKFYHAHIYYDPAASKERANRLRERVGERFPQATVGRWHDENVGPHLQSMYQVAFPSEMLAAFVPWLMLNRDGLTILLHPETGNSYQDHTAHAAWFGAVLPLRLEAFGDRKG
jgi:DOPA 4,5-dioxygenase